MDSDHTEDFGGEASIDGEDVSESDNHYANGASTSGEYDEPEESGSVGDDGSVTENDERYDAYRNDHGNDGERSPGSPAAEYEEADNDDDEQVDIEDFQSDDQDTSHRRRPRNLQGSENESYDDGDEVQGWREAQEVAADESGQEMEEDDSEVEGHGEADSDDAHSFDNEEDEEDNFEGNDKDKEVDFDGNGYDDNIPDYAEGEAEDEDEDEDEVEGEIERSIGEFRDENNQEFETDNRNARKSWPNLRSRTNYSGSDTVENETASDENEDGVGLSDHDYDEDNGSPVAEDVDEDDSKPFRGSTAENVSDRNDSDDDESNKMFEDARERSAYRKGDKSTAKFDKTNSKKVAKHATRHNSPRQQQPSRPFIEERVSRDIQKRKYQEDSEIRPRDSKKIVDAEKSQSKRYPGQISGSRAKYEPVFDQSPVDGEAGVLSRPKRQRRRPQRLEATQPALSRRASLGLQSGSSADRAGIRSMRPAPHGSASAGPTTRRSVKVDEDASTVSMHSSESSSPPPETVDPLDLLPAAKLQVQNAPDKYQAVEAFHAWQLRTISAESSYQKTLHAYLKRKLRKRVAKSQEQDRMEDEALRNACSAPSNADSPRVSDSSDDNAWRHSAQEIAQRSGKRVQPSTQTKSRSSGPSKKQKGMDDDIVPGKIRPSLEAYFPVRIRRALSVVPLEELLSKVPSTPTSSRGKGATNAACGRKLNVRLRLQGKNKPLSKTG